MVEVSALAGEVPLDGGNALADFRLLLLAGGPLLDMPSVGGLQATFESGKPLLNRLVSPDDFARRLHASGPGEGGPARPAVRVGDSLGSAEQGSQPLEKPWRPFASLKPPDVPYEEKQPDELDQVAGNESHRHSIDTATVRPGADTL